MFAIRLARPFTGRPNLTRIEGGYHGTLDGRTEPPTANAEGF